MRKPTHLRRKLLLLGLFAMVLAVWLLLDLHCIPRTVTGLICPGCGMTRAWEAALKLDLAGAIRYHPMFWSIPVLVLYILYDGQLFQNRKVNSWVLGLLLGALLVCYLFRLILFLNGTLPI